MVEASAHPINEKHGGVGHGKQGCQLMVPLQVVFPASPYQAELASDRGILAQSDREDVVLWKLENAFSRWFVLSINTQLLYFVMVNGRAKLPYCKVLSKASGFWLCICIWDFLFNNNELSLLHLVCLWYWKSSWLTVSLELLWLHYNECLIIVLL